MGGNSSKEAAKKSTASSSRATDSVTVGSIASLTSVARWSSSPYTTYSCATLQAYLVATHDHLDVPASIANLIASYASHEHRLIAIMTDIPSNTHHSDDEKLRIGGCDLHVAIWNASNASSRVTSSLSLVDDITATKVEPTEPVLPSVDPVRAGFHDPRAPDGGGGSKRSGPTEQQTMDRLFGADEVVIREKTMDLNPASGTISEHKRAVLGGDDDDTMAQSSVYKTPRRVIEPTAYMNHIDGTLVIADQVTGPSDLRLYSYNVNTTPQWNTTVAPWKRPGNRWNVDYIGGRIVGIDRTGVVCMMNPSSAIPVAAAAAATSDNTDDVACLLPSPVHVMRAGAPSIHHSFITAVSGNRWFVYHPKSGDGEVFDTTTGKWSILSPLPPVECEGIRPLLVPVGHNGILIVPAAIDDINRRDIMYVAGDGTPSYRVAWNLASIIPHFYSISNAWIIDDATLVIIGRHRDHGDSQWQRHFGSINDVIAAAPVSLPLAAITTATVRAAAITLLRHDDSVPRVTLIGEWTFVRSLQSLYTMGSQTLEYVMT